MKKLYTRIAIAGFTTVLATSALSACVEQAGTAPTDGAYKIARGTGFLVDDIGCEDHNVDLK